MNTQPRKALAMVVAALALVALTVTGTVLYLRWEHTAADSHTAEYFCPMHPQIVRGEPGECPICEMKLEKRAQGASPAPAAQRRILYYRHPMNPSVHSTVPAKDEMGMDYAPVYEDEVMGQ